jgi:hypothetical protein
MELPSNYILLTNFDELGLQKIRKIDLNEKKKEDQNIMKYLDLILTNIMKQLKDKWMALQIFLQFLWELYLLMLLLQ